MSDPMNELFLPAALTDGQVADEPIDVLAAIVAEQPAWMADAACRGHDVEKWFPARGESTAEAKAICGACPVCRECGEYALEHNLWQGVWGGWSGRTRRPLRRMWREQESA